MLSLIVYMLFAQIGFDSELLSKARGLGALQKLQEPDMIQELLLSNDTVEQLKKLSIDSQAWLTPPRGPKPPIGDGKPRHVQLRMEVNARVEAELSRLIAPNLFRDYSRWAVRNTCRPEDADQRVLRQQVPDDFGVLLLGLPTVQDYLGPIPKAELATLEAEVAKLKVAQVKLRYQGVDNIMANFPAETRMRVDALLGRPIEPEIDLFGWRTVPLGKQVAFAPSQKAIVLPPLPEIRVTSLSIMFIGWDAHFPADEKLRESLRLLQSQIEKEKLDFTRPAPGRATITQPELRKQWDIFDARTKEELKRLLSKEQFQLLTQKAFRGTLNGGLEAFFADGEVKSYLGEEFIQEPKLPVLIGQQEALIAEEFAKSCNGLFKVYLKKLDKTALDRLANLVELPE